MPRRRAKEEQRPLTLPDPDLNIDRVSDRRLLELAIMATPDPLYPGRHIPSTRFASDFAFCNDRTIRRYEVGERDLPPLLREKCLEIVRDAQAQARKKAKRKLAATAE